MMSQQNHIYPDFIGVGAMRCGTTWIADMLRAHPDIYIPAHFKELHFFDRHFEKGQAWYFENFADKGADQIAGEFTPAYMRSKQAMEQLAATCPDAKLIISLRHPAERAYSHYTFLKNRKSISSSFYDALFDERFEILKAGLFGEQLEQCLSLFSRENVHVIIFDEIRSNPEGVLKSLYGFLGVAPDFIPQQTSEKVNARHRVRFKFLAQIIQQLKHFLRSSIRGRQGLVRVGFFKLGRIINRLNSTSIDKEPIDEQARAYLRQYYEKDLLKLNSHLSGKVQSWLTPDKGQVS